MGRTLAASALVILAAFSAAAQEQAEVIVGYVHPAERLLTLSLVDRPPEDLGVAGALLATEDNNTTGRFMGQEFTLLAAPVDSAEQATAAVDRLVDAGARWIVSDLGPELLRVTADAADAQGALVLNTGARDDVLRTTECDETIVHVVPSRAMLADALAQYLAWKKWSRWLLLVGSHPVDQAYAEAIRRAANRFGARIVEERVFEDTGGARTTDSGHVQVQRQMPVFTQGAPEHDVVIVADENEVFGTHVPYNTWDPRPVAGTAGLTPTVWSRAHMQWAGIQVQNRFNDAFDRRMRSEDMLAWMAVRMIGEAATRTGSAEPDAINAYLLGPDFELAAFKGQALTLRPWNRQLRQPILLADGKTVVSVSPQEGFLHKLSFLDTLGYDRPESECRFDS